MSRTPTRVLVVHPDPGIGEKIAGAIVRAGFEASSVTSGERAMDRFIQEPADVLVVDQDLEGRDGVATVGAIRWMPGGRRARVVLMSQEDHGEKSLEDLGKSVDAFASIVGTWDFETIASAVARAAAARPHDAETREVSVEQARLEAERTPVETREVSIEQARLEAERARPPGGWDDITNPGGSTAVLREQGDDAGAEWRDTDGRAEGREVRAAREAAEQTHSDLAGGFDQVPFARLLRRLADRRATGALVCVHPADGRPTTEGDEPTKIVYFRAGVPVHVRSNVVSECLGQVLVRQSKIGPATLDESLAAVHRGEGLQGEVLMQMGALTALDLSEALADQLRTKLTEIFGWQRGTFRFVSDRPPPRSLVDLGLGLAEITLLGVREGMAPSQVLDRLAPHAERYPILEPRELVRFLRLGPKETIRAVDGTRRTSELLARSRDALATAQLLYAMECMDAVRFAEAPIGPPRESAFEEVEEERTPLEARPLAAIEANAEQLFAAEPEIAPLHTVQAPRARIATPPPVVPRSRADREDSGLRRQTPPSEESDPEILDERVERLLAAERYFRRAQSALDRGRADEAVRALTRASQLCPDEGQFLSYLGWAKHAAAPDDAFVLSEAVDLAERGSVRAPELAIGHLLRGRLLTAIGRTAEARAAFRRCLELDPSLEEARAAIAHD